MKSVKPDFLDAHTQYGLWPADGSCRNLVDAQKNLLQRLMEDFPPNPARILVVGVRIGLSVSSIVQKGYQVTVVEPVGDLLQHALEGLNRHEVDSRTADFMADDSIGEQSFDVLLFLETANRIGSLDEMINRARFFLRDNGSLIIASETCYQRRFAQEMNLKTPADFMISLSENGFFVTKKENMTGRVSATPDFLMNMSALRTKASHPDGVNGEREEKELGGLDHWGKRKQWFQNNQLEYEIFIAKKSRFFLRTYRPGDEDQILELFKQSFHTERRIDHWNWKYKNNPYGSLKIALAVDEEGTLAAHYAGYPVPFCLAKDEMSTSQYFLAYHNADTMTRQQFRNVGLGRTNLLSRVFYYFIAKFSEDSLSFYYGYNTDKIKILGKRYMGYNYIDPVILRRRDLNTKPVRNPGAFKKFSSGFSVEEVQEVNSEWDDFFDRVSTDYGLLVHRSAEYLRWRYLVCPDKIHRLFAIRKRKRLVGWSVFSLIGNKLIWGDALFDKNFHESLEFLLYHVKKAAYPDAESVEAWFTPHPQWWNEQLDQLEFDKLPEPQGLTPCAQHNLFNDQKGPSVIEQERDCFYYTKGDSDLF